MPLEGAVAQQACAFSRVKKDTNKDESKAYRIKCSIQGIRISVGISVFY